MAFPFHRNLVTHFAGRPHVVISVLVFLGYLFAARQPQVVDVTSTPAASYMLMTINGFGGGKYQVGKTVHIWANPSEEGWIFDTWQGTIQPLPDARAMHITLPMPAEDMKIEAVYKPIPKWNASATMMFGRNVYYYFPTADYRGLILFFHGSGSDASQWLDLTERRRFFDDMIAEGYAFLGFDSTDRNEKQWDLSMPPASNPDLDALEAILQEFRANGQIPPQIPIYSVGMSRGGRFASLAAYLLNMKATAIWVGLGHEDAMKITDIPTMWCLAAHDPIIDKDEAYAQYQQLLQRKVDTAYYVHPQMPIYPENFVGVEGIDRAGSEQLFADLKSQGYLNDEYFLTENPRISRWEKHIGLDYSEAARLDMQDRLFVAFAEHTFYSDCDRSVLDFFNSHP